MEGIAIGINLSGNMISDVKHNRNIIVLLESCESLTSGSGIPCMVHNI